MINESFVMIFLPFPSDCVFQVMWSGKKMAVFIENDPTKLIIELKLKLDMHVQGWQLGMLFCRTVTC